MTPINKLPRPGPSQVHRYVPLTLRGENSDIPLQNLRTSCDFSSNWGDPSNNILAETGKSIKGGLLKIKSIKVTNVSLTDHATVFTPGNSQFWGTLTVDYDEDRLIRPLRPISIPLFISVNHELGFSFARPIQSCTYPQKVRHCYASSNHRQDGHTSIACKTNAPKSHSVSLGANAGNTSAALTQNTSIGYKSLGQNPKVPGIWRNAANTLIGHKTGSDAQEDENVAIGHESLHIQRRGKNTAVGHQAGYSMFRGEKNTFIGYQAGRRASGPHHRHSSNSGELNTYLGYQTGNHLRFSAGNTFIGYQAMAPKELTQFFPDQRKGDVETNNSILLGHSNDFKPWFQDEFLIKDWLKGKVGQDILSVNGKDLHGPPSSRALKKNIQPWEDFEETLSSSPKHSSVHL